MGCFNHKCNFSQLRARYGDRIVVLVGVRMTKNMLDADGFSPGNSFTPISVPIRGTYNDYGSIENVDRTPGVEALERYFDMNVEKIVDCAERITCGCKFQIEEDYKKINEILKSELLDEYYNDKYGLEFSYIMEHEDIFDSLIAMSDIAVKDVYHWWIPHKFIESLGYKKNIIGKDNGYDVINWTHECLPALKESCYVWKVEDFGKFGEIVHTIADFCKYVGCEIPEHYNKSYYETCFLSDIEDMKNEEFDGLLSPERLSMYSFSRRGNRGMFGYESNNGFNNFKLISLGDENKHLDIKYMKEVIEIALLYDAMNILQMTWNNTSYYRQDLHYEHHIDFLKKCLEVAEEKKTSYEE